MDKRTEGCVKPGKLTEGELNQLSALDAVELITRNDAENAATEEGLELFLRSWWSKTYNRPLKDPLLNTYNLYELLYEYRDKIERQRVAEVGFEREADKIEDAKTEENLAWIEEEERREQKEAEAAQKAKLEADEKWMLEQLKKEKGDDFGDDIDLNFQE